MAPLGRIIPCGCWNCSCGKHRSVVPSYRIGALSWLAGRSLYDEVMGVGGFVYFPQAAILFVPFALLPEVLGEVALASLEYWRICIWAPGLARMAGEHTGKELFPLMS